MGQERPCDGEGCTQPAKMQCPTCAKNKLEPSFFCSQDCFKANWQSHKVKHQPSTKIPLCASCLSQHNCVAVTNPWPNFKYTGSLRPFYPLSARRVVPEHIQKPDYALDGIPKSEQKLRGSTVISTLTSDEIEKMRRACALGRHVLNKAAAALRVGITTDEIDKIVHEETIRHGAYPSPLNYHGFPKSCCTSVNEVICHGIPDRRPLEDGDIVNLDVTVYLDGFHGDLNGTYCVGTVDEAGKKLIQSARECLDEAIKMCKPGVRYRELGDTIQAVAKRYGHSVTRTYCGHGIHRLFHCLPNVPHYASTFQ